MKQYLKRARQVHLLLAFGLAAIQTEKAMAQTCATPLTLTINDCNSYAVNDTVVWLSFNSGSGGSWCDINLTIPISTPNSIIGAELYAGTCNSLALAQAASYDLDEVVIRTTITASTNYLLKVTLANSSSSLINVCSNVVTSSVPCPTCITDGCQLVCNPDLELCAWSNSSHHLGNFVSANVCNWGTPTIAAAPPGVTGSTAEYFTPNSSDPDVFAPGNFFGTESAHSGIAYGGIYCYYDTHTDYREYLQHQLQQPLIAGQWYTLTFWVSLSDYSGVAINHLGAYISNTQPTQYAPGVLLTNTPQVASTAVISTISGWAPISQPFQANGGEQWITIGSFENDFAQQRINVSPTVVFPSPHPPTNPNDGSYYFIDDITLELTQDPCFNWNRTCENVNFSNITNACTPQIVSEWWDFGDPVSGPSNFSTSSNPSHVYTQNNTSYTVTHIVQTPNNNYTCTVQIISQTGSPVAQIVGYAANNCGTGTMNYVASPCDPNVQYSWTVTGGTIVGPSNTCSVDVSWSAAGGTITLNAVQIPPDCGSSVTLEIPPCCDDLAGLRIHNMLASQALALYGSGSTIQTSTEIYITGVFTIDVPITFLNCDLIYIGGNTPINVNPGQSITFANCTTENKCGYMWDGVYVPDPSASVNVNGGSLIQYAKNAVVSNNGGVYTITDSKFDNNYKDIIINTFNGTHTGTIRNTDFTMTGFFLPALPSFPVGHNKTVCGIEINNNTDITIGDATQLSYRNRFDNILVGIRCSGSNTKIVNAAFSNFQPTLAQFTVPNAGTGVVSTGGRSLYVALGLTVGGTGFARCSFSDMRIGIDCYEPQKVHILSNSIGKIRQFGVRIQRDRGSNITVSNNSFNNQGYGFGFQTAILMLECYSSTILINTNQIRQSNAVPQQVGTGIRVGLVAPGDLLLNIVGNTIERVRTGVWTQNLVGKQHVFITDNVIRFFKQNPQYTAVHYGIRLAECATVECHSNDVIKMSNSSPTQTMVQQLRGISIENSPGTLATNNTFTRLGSGLFGIDNSGSSTLACNYMDWCYNGVFFATNPNTGLGCDIGNQVLDPNGVPAATGNQWSNNISVNEIDGAVIAPGIVWLWDAIQPANNAQNITCDQTTQNSYNACSTFFALPPAPVERDKLTGTALRTAADSNSISEQRYQLHRTAHRTLSQNPAWLSLGTPDDSIYQNFYSTYDPTNIGSLRQIETAADTGGYLVVTSICNSLTCSNLMEHNAKVVYAIYASTWLQGLTEFASADSATLLSIANQDPVLGGTAVLSAQIMLNLAIDYYGASSQRIGQAYEDSTAEVTNEVKVYPNPASDIGFFEVSVGETQDAELQIYDLAGKVIFTQKLTTQQVIHSIDLSQLTEGVFVFRVVIDGETSEGRRLVILR